MAGKLTSSASSDRSKSFPPDQTAKSFWRSPAAWIILCLLLVPLVVLEQAIQSRINGWRVGTREKVTQLYETLQAQGAAGVDPNELRDSAEMTNLSSIDGTFGTVKSYRIVQLTESVPDKEIVELFVDRGSNGNEAEFVTVDANGLIEDIQRQQASPSAPAVGARKLGPTQPQFKRPSH